VAYQMTVTLTEEEYEALAAEAAKSGKEPAALLHDLIRDLQSARIKRPMTGQELAEQLYHEGKLANLATREPITPEEQAERERLARLFAGGKPASRMVIEDRGPY
jgi:hypothetical protein